MNKTIRMTLDPASINAAVRELEAYKKRVIERTEELRKRVAQYIVDHAQPVFDSAVAADLIMSKDIGPGAKWEHESPRTGDVEVTMRDNGDITLVIATGHDAIFMEFGAGIFHNTPVGESPHPKANRFTIGSYGPNGAKEAWGYKGTDGRIYITHGTPASMPMYRATQAAINDIATIAREVFSK